VLKQEISASARLMRGAKPRVFYSMRSLADYFNVPLRTIALIYQSLEKEGLLNRIRGSQTMLLGNTLLPREAVRGVVGFPMWLQSIAVLPSQRIFVSALEDKLRRAGFVLDVIFLTTKEEQAQPEFALRLLEHRLDVALIYSPYPGSRQNILTLREHNTRVIITQPMEAATNLPAIIYLENWQVGYEKMAARWFAEGIRTVIIASPISHLHYASEADTFCSIMKQAGLETEVKGADPREILKMCRRKNLKNRSAVAFLDTTNSEKVCNREPVLIEEISRVARLAFCRGAIRVPYLQFRNIRPDVVRIPAIEAATRIASDICQLPMLREGVLGTFNAEYLQTAEFEEPEGLR